MPHFLAETAPSDCRATANARPEVRTCHRLHGYTTKTTVLQGLSWRFQLCRTQEMQGDPFGLLLQQRIVFMGGEVSLMIIPAGFERDEYFALS